MTTMPPKYKTKTKTRTRSKAKKPTTHNPKKQRGNGTRQNVRVNVVQDANADPLVPTTSRHPRVDNEKSLIDAYHFSATATDHFAAA
jgi:ABC-type uncharacterized transport system involved in gliding motility auxiliary subunit